MDNRRHRHPAEIPNDEFTHRVLGCGISVHKRIGVGLLENAYESYYERELIKNGFSVVRQHPLPAEDDDLTVDLAYVPDLVVDGKLIIEIKTVTHLLPVHDAQVLTYLKFSGISVGLLMNFHSKTLMSGVRRLVWNHNDPDAPAPRDVADVPEVPDVPDVPKSP
jgi:GxxExxY protein